MLMNELVQMANVVGSRFIGFSLLDQPARTRLSRRFSGIVHHRVPSWRNDRGRVGLFDDRGTGDPLVAGQRSPASRLPNLQIHFPVHRTPRAGFLGSLEHRWRLVTDRWLLDLPTAASLTLAISIRAIWAASCSRIASVLIEGLDEACHKILIHWPASTGIVMYLLWPK